MNQTNNHNDRWEDSALVYYQKAYGYFTSLGSQANVAYEKLRIGHILLDKGGDAKAIPYLKEALASFNDNKDYAYAADALGLLHKAMAAKGMYADAYRYSLQELYYKDTLSANNRKEVVASMLAKYEVDRRDRTIALLNAQEKLTAAQLHHSHVMDIIYSVLALVAVVLVFMFFNIYRVRQRLKEVEMRNRLAGDLHDEVGSSLSSILLLSKMALNHNSNQAIQQQLLGTIKGNAEEVIDRMSDIVWTTDPKFDEGSSLRARMENYLDQVRQSTGLLVHAELDEELVNAAYPMDMRKNIFLIFKEAVNNVAKHAQATGLTVQLRKTESEMILSITDNGQGITPGEKPSGKGLESMQQRAALLGGTLAVAPAGNPTGGTSIILHIPLHRRNHITTKNHTHGNQPLKH